MEKYVVLGIVVSLASSSLAKPIIPDSSKVKIKQIQEMYRPLNLMGGKFLDKIGFHHTAVIATTDKGDKILIHSQVGKGAVSQPMTSVSRVNDISVWKPKGPLLEAKPGTTVADAMNVAKEGGAAYKILDNNCNDVSARVVAELQDPFKMWEKEREKKTKGH